MTGNSKHQIRNPKEIRMVKRANPRPSLVREDVTAYGAGNGKRYDLEERTFRFAQDVRRFVKTWPRTIGNIEDVKQLVRASGSVGANYIEANESLGQKDFVMKIKICRKEAKESRFFLRLADVGGRDGSERERLVQEATELMNIFGAIFRKTR
jgi:four helix bundle protein